MSIPLYIIVVYTVKLKKKILSSSPLPAVPYTEEAVEEQNEILCAQGCVLFNYREFAGGVSALRKYHVNTVKPFLSGL